MLEIFPFIILALASYRATRFLVIDTLLEGLRSRFHTFLINRTQKEGPLKLVWLKAYELTSCTWCTGFWVSAGLYALWLNDYYYSRTVIIALAIAGVQGMIHALEPDDE